MHLNMLNKMQETPLVNTRDKWLLKKNPISHSCMLCSQMTKLEGFAKGEEQQSEPKKASQI